MDFQSFLDYVATVGYDVDFLRGGAIDLLDENPIAEGQGAERFDPSSAPRGALAASGPWAARLLQGGGTFIDELAGTATWRGSLDLPASARRVGDMVCGWMAAELPREADLISQAGNAFPVGATEAEQFYSLRDAIHFSEQWLPGTTSSRPALILLLAFCIGVDEFLCPVNSLDTAVFLGRQISHLWDDCLVECGGRDDAAGWLGLARAALRSSVFLQNREKLAHLKLVEEDQDVFTDWDTTAHYMLRAEAAMTPFVGFMLCAYAGLPFDPKLTGAVGLYCYGNAFVLDFCKRSTRLGGGNFTEIALQDRVAELQGRSHLIGAILAYGEAVLPPLVLCVLRPYVLATSSVMDVLDRYRERSWGKRLPVGHATLWMMKAVMSGAGATLGDSPKPSKSLTPATAAALEAIEGMDAWDAYDSYVAKPSVEAFYRLPRPVRLALQAIDAQSDEVRRSPADSPAAAEGHSTNGHGSQSWMDSLSVAHPPPAPSCPTPKLDRELPPFPAAHLPPVHVIGTTGLDALIVRSPARPGGYAGGYRDFMGRPAGSSA